MITFAAHRTRNIAAGVCLLAVVAAPGPALSQSTLGQPTQRELAIIDALERAETEHGPQAEELIEPLTALTLFYEEAGELRLADATIERLLSLIRANYGLYSLEQAPAIQLLIAHERERGNAASAWELEQGLIRLGLRNPDDVRTGRIFRDVGDVRTDILKRYRAGELPPEIELGCYYHDSNEHIRAERRGSRPLSAAPGQPHGDSCAAGSRSDARRALANQAHAFYIAAVEIFLLNDLGDSEELRALLTKLVHGSYENYAPSLGRSSLRQLIESYPENSGNWLPRIEALVQLADWDLYYSPVLGTRYRDTALAGYEEAYALLLEHGFAQAVIDAIFSPDVPVMLPSFRRNPLVSPETATSTGHIDVEFVVTREGKSDDIEILETTTPDVPRDVRRDLVGEIKRSQFRPMVTNGSPTDSEPVVVRYFLND